MNYKLEVTVSFYKKDEDGEVYTEHITYRLEGTDVKAILDEALRIQESCGTLNPWISEYKFVS